MQCTYAQYCRLNVPVWASDREVIKAAHLMLRKAARKSRHSRDIRHNWLRSVIHQHHDALMVYREVVR